jgi:YegS/Rv2252/BmrU family lipid kinase
MSEKVLFICNPHSGKGLIRQDLLDIIDTMVKADFEVTVYTTQSQGDAVQKIEKEAARFDRIITSGGDGTLDEVVTGVIRSGADIPIGYIPAGSTNDFANSLGLPKERLLAAKTAISGVPFPCDAGYFNGDTFVYVAAFGMFTNVSYETPQEMKNTLGHLAYILEGVKQLQNIPSYHMEVHCNGNVIQDTFIYGMITNSVSVGGFKGITGSNVRLDDGIFEVTLIRTPHNPIELNEIIACLTNLIDDSDLIYTFKTSEIWFNSKEKIAWTLDGEYGGEHDELLVRSLKQRIRIMVAPPEETDVHNVNL